MKINNLGLGALLVLISMTTQAQDKKLLSLEEVMQMAFSNSNDSKLLDAQVDQKRLQFEASRNNILPDIKLSGSYLAMNSPNVDLNIGQTNTTNDIAVNQLMIGQLSVNMPIYTGGKIKNTIKSAQDSWKATQLQNAASKENVAIQAMHIYTALYKAQQTKNLIAENIKKSEQQVLDFQAMEENGIIPRNDLLKAQLQLSNYKVSYQEAAKNVQILNYRLNTLIGIDENIELENITIASDFPIALIQGNASNRLEIQSLEAQKDVAIDQLKVLKSDYYPSVAATAGYAALNLPSLLTVTNAANIGVGVNYNIGSLYKNKKKINVAKQSIDEVDLTILQTREKIKNQINEAYREMILAQQKLKLFEEARVQAKENYRIVKDKYDNGISETDDLLEADVQLLQSEINLAIGKADIVEKSYELQIANGNLNLK